MAWLKQQHRALRQFYRDEFSESLLITSAAFLIIWVLSCGVGLINKTIPETIVAYFSRMLENSNVLSEDGAINLLALFGNNLRATLVSVLYGFIPFIYLTALALGMNALILGVLAAYYINSGTSLAIYFAGIVPHGIFELPALLLAFAMGLMLCKRITQFVRKNTKGIMVPLLKNCARAYLMHVLPLLTVAAVVEVYVTPRVLDLFM